MSPDPIDFYFDFISPYGYFASLRVEETGHMRLVAMRVQRQLGRAGGAAGMETGRHALRHKLRIEGQNIG